VGVVLAALLFMQRMAALTEGRIVLETEDESAPVRLPKGVSLYEINGPLFFGAAQNAMATLVASRDTYRVLILHLGKVPSIDATGLVALENAVEGLLRRKKTVILAGPLPRPVEVWGKAEFAREREGFQVLATLDMAIERAAAIVAGATSVNR
jgi:SulP family sulfate permease